ncbi:unnamed protein product, partial [Choristocarpus tenellus]
CSQWKNGRKRGKGQWGHSRYRNISQQRSSQSTSSEEDGMHCRQQHHRRSSSLSSPNAWSCSTGLEERNKGNGEEKGQESQEKQEEKNKMDSDQLEHSHHLCDRRKKYRNSCRSDIECSSPSSESSYHKHHPPGRYPLPPISTSFSPCTMSSAASVNSMSHNCCSSGVTCSHSYG